MTDILDTLKTEDDYFRDWEGAVFGFGYGTGEQYVLAELRRFMLNVSGEGGYDYAILEAAVGPSVAWLLINALCKADIIEYGTSPRYGWLTDKGKRLRAYVTGHTADELVEVVCSDPDSYFACYPDYCNCGPSHKCSNPFW